MKNLTLFILLLFFTISGFTQEINSGNSLYIGRLELRPSLSIMANELPTRKFTLIEVNFNKVQKREVNLIAMMEQERYEKENASVELDAPMPNLGKSEKSFIELTNEIRIHDRSSNYDIYTGEKKIPAYEEMRVPLFSSPYHRGSRARSYFSPYSYSSFLR